MDYSVNVVEAHDLLRRTGANFPVANVGEIAILNLPTIENFDEVRKSHNKQLLTTPGECPSDFLELFFIDFARSLLMCYHAIILATVHDFGNFSLVILLNRIILASSVFWSCFSIESD
jgi:hypothetical protein